MLAVNRRIIIREWKKKKHNVITFCNNSKNMKKKKKRMKNTNIEIVFFFFFFDNQITIILIIVTVNDRTNRDKKILSISKKNATEKHCFGWAWTHSIYMPSKLCWWFIPFLEASLAIHLPSATRQVNNNRPIYNHIACKTVSHSLCTISTYLSFFVAICLSTDTSIHL